MGDSRQAVDNVVCDAVPLQVLGAMGMHSLKVLTVATLATATTLLAGCYNTNDRKRTDDLVKEVATLKKQQEDLKKELEEWPFRLEIAESGIQWDSSVRLTPGSDGYSVVRSNLGPMTVKFDNVQPYANGSRVTLRFGNLTSASIDGLTATASWGKDNSDPGKAVGTREVKFKDTLRSGAWTTTSIVLEKIPPSELAFLTLSEISHDAISLRR
jgi:outer membrane murein-binding lipoprotein Lpp